MKMLKTMQTVLFLLMLPVVLAGQQTIFNSMDDDPTWRGQLDPYDDPETRVIVSYVSEPVMFGAGAMQLIWGVTQNQSTGGKSVLSHTYWDPAGVYDWSEFDSLTFWYYVEDPSSIPGAVQLRLVLGDVSDSQEGAGTKSFSSMECWGTTQNILDDPSGWNKIAIPLASAGQDPGGNGFERSGSEGIAGNDALDLNMVKGFQFEFLSSASEGDAATGLLYLDHLILTTAGGDTSVIMSMDEDPYWNSQRDREDEVETKVILTYVSDPVMFGDGAMWLDWGVTNNESWGGGSYMNHVQPDSNGVFDWTDYDTLAFWYNVQYPSSMPGTVHLRLNLGDVSDAEPGYKQSDFGAMEYWYSFHYILDDEPGWKKIAIPLIDVRDDPNSNGFERTGWYGIEGNDILDLDMIKGFQFEFSMSASEGDIAMGTIVIDNMALYSGEYDLTRVRHKPLVKPRLYQLTQNFPNPFNGMTTIGYMLPESGPVTIRLFDLLGKEVKTLVNRDQSAGSHRVRINADEFTSGTYFYRIDAGSFTQTKKMILMK